MKRILYLSLALLTGTLAQACQAPRILFQNKRGHPLEMPEYIREKSILNKPRFISDDSYTVKNLNQGLQIVTLNAPELQDVVAWERCMYFIQMKPGELVEHCKNTKMSLVQVKKLIDCYDLAQTLKLPIAKDLKDIIALKEQEFKEIPQPFWKRKSTLYGMGSATLMALALGGYGLYKWAYSK